MLLAKSACAAPLQRRIVFRIRASLLVKSLRPPCGSDGARVTGAFRPRQAFYWPLGLLRFELPRGDDGSPESLTIGNVNAPPPDKVRAPVFGDRNDHGHRLGLGITVSFFFEITRVRGSVNNARHRPGILSGNAQVFVGTCEA